MKRAFKSEPIDIKTYLEKGRVMPVLPNTDPWSEALAHGLLATEKYAGVKTRTHNLRFDPGAVVLFYTSSREAEGARYLLHMNYSDGVSEVNQKRIHGWGVYERTVDTYDRTGSEEDQMLRAEAQIALDGARSKVTDKEFRENWGLIEYIINSKQIFSVAGAAQYVLCFSHVQPFTPSIEFSYPAGSVTRAYAKVESVEPLQFEPVSAEFAKLSDQLSVADLIELDARMRIGS